MVQSHIHISASILGFFFDAKAQKQTDTQMIETINTAIAKKSSSFDILHLDIEDGLFVAHKSFKPSHLKKIVCHKKREIHFMVVDYEQYVKDYFDCAQTFIIHQEVIKKSFPEFVQRMHTAGKHVGISINPTTSVLEIKHLELIDTVLLMSVTPGLPAQQFLATTIRKMQRLKAIRKEKKLSFTIAVDGGVNQSNIQKCADAGADIVVMGTGLFRS